jgi:hypothetical protein
MTERQSNVLARNVKQVEAFQREPEIDSHEFFALDEVARMIDDGEIDDNQTIAGLYLYRSWLDANKPSVV